MKKKSYIQKCKAIFKCFIFLKTTCSFLVSLYKCDNKLSDVFLFLVDLQRVCSVIKYRLHTVAPDIYRLFYIKYLHFTDSINVKKKMK